MGLSIPAPAVEESVLSTASPPGRVTSRGRRLWRTFLRNRTSLAGLFLVLLVVFTAVAAPWLAPFDPLEQNTRERLAPPSAEHIMGQDNFGRDVFSRIIYGSRVSLLVAVLAVFLGGVVGTVMGLVAGYLGGKIETVLMRVVDVVMAFPSLLLGLTIMAVLGAGLNKMIIAIGIMLTPAFARVVYASTLSIGKREYVDAARVVGSRRGRILRIHILPNLMSDILVLASIWAASAIRVEASLSFIGLGVSPPTPTWGNMIRDGTQHLTNAPWLSVFPGLAIFITVLGFNLLGDGLRDVFDPQAQ